MRCAAFSEVVPLGEGLAGAAFHGLIRLGYGVGSETRARSPGGWRTCARGVRCWRHRARRGAGTRPGVAEAMPEASDRAGVTVFDLLNLVAGTGVPGRSVGVSGPANPVVRDAPNRWTRPLSLRRLSRRAEIRRPSSPSMRSPGCTRWSRSTRLVGGAPPSVGLGSNRVLVSWWTAMAVAVRACSVLMAQRRPKPTKPNPLGTLPRRWHHRRGSGEVAGLWRDPRREARRRLASPGPVRTLGRSGCRSVRHPQVGRASTRLRPAIEGADLVHRKAAGGEKWPLVWATATTPPISTSDGMPSTSLSSSSYFRRLVTKHVPRPRLRHANWKLHIAGKIVP